MSFLGPKIIIVPPGDDPYKYHLRWKKKSLWQRTDWRKGVKFGLVALPVLAGAAFVAVKLLGG